MKRFWRMLRARLATPLFFCYYVTKVAKNRQKLSEKTIAILRKGPGIGDSPAGEFPERKN
jgi:hypothetical protein